MKDISLFGILKPNEKIQPIREMATSLGINPNTVKKAYEELESLGAIVTISTKGTFVADNTKKVLEKKIEEKLSLIQSEIQELEKMGMTREEIIEKI
ncbi:MAG: GntR family transcriptional regulator [Clostridia bacterium]|nr:GntR family transcriptional regulator [Clostridia bacterium]